MRKTPGGGGVLKMRPPTPGGKNRSREVPRTVTNASPWKLGTLTRAATPSIFDFFHWIGNVSGVLNRTPKS